eukprot:1181926-Prorocentrum_minimum.AAC.2
MSCTFTRPLTVSPLMSRTFTSSFAVAQPHRHYRGESEYAAVNTHTGSARVSVGFACVSVGFARVSVGFARVSVGFACVLSLPMTLPRGHRCLCSFLGFSAARTGGAVT